MTTLHSMQALEEQVSKDGYRIERSQPFKFKSVVKKNAEPELYIKVTSSRKHKPRDIAWDPNPPQV